MSDILRAPTKKVLPTAEYVRSVLSYDPETGLLHWLKSGPSRRKSLVAGTDHGNGYWATHVQNRLCYNHRLALLLTYGKWPEHEVDHINGIRSDNRLCNLREVSRTWNMQNRLIPKKHNASKVLGAHKHGSGYVSRITVNRKQNYLGYFKTAEEAHSAYLEAKRRLHPGCTI